MSKNKSAVRSLSICRVIDWWELMINCSLYTLWSENDSFDPNGWNDPKKETHVYIQGHTEMELHNTVPHKLCNINDVLFNLLHRLKLEMYQMRDYVTSALFRWCYCVVLRLKRSWFYIWQNAEGDISKTNNEMLNFLPLPWAAGSSGKSL